MRRSLLKGVLEELGLKGRVSKSFDVVGDIAILRLLPGADVEEERLRRLAEWLLAKLPYVKTVYVDESGVRGEHRLRSLKLLAGEPRSETVYREYGMVFRVDVLHAYVSPRLSYEHHRVARLVREGERVLNMFAGVGLFSVFIARLSRPRKVYSVDINPIAYRLMVENVRLNGVEGVVEPILGDAAVVASTVLRRSVDRVLMPLPSFSSRFYCAAIDALERDGFLHAYEFVRVERGESRAQALSKGFEALRRVVEGCGRRAGLSLSLARVVRSVGPRLLEAVYDVEVRQAETP